MRGVARVGLGVLAVALVVGGTLVVFGFPLGESLRLLFEGSMGDGVAWTRTLVRATPLVLCGLGTLLAWRTGMFNIGGEGQFVIGGLSGAVLVHAASSWNPGLLNVGILAASALGGAVYAALAGWLHVRRGVQVVISTILLNFVALQLMGWAVTGPLKAPGGLPVTERVPEAAMLWRLSRQSDLHSGVFLAVAVAVAVWVFLFATRTGFRWRLVGAGPRVARAVCIDPGRVQIAAMAASGALCGLAGGVEYTALAGQIDTGFAQNWGFLAIPVALVGALNPLGVLASAVGFGALFAGSENLARFTPQGGTLGALIQGWVVLGLVGWSAWRERRAPAEAA